MKRKKIIIIIAAVVLLVVAAGAVYYFFIRDDGGDTQEKNTEKASDYYDYAIEDSFVTNVKDSSKLFKTTIVLVADDDGLEEYFDENQYVIRDIILFKLRDLSEADIRSADVKDMLRESIPAALNEALDTEYIVSVYFTDFVMQ